MNEEFNNLDGAVDLYDAVDSITPISNKYFDAENFYPADGRRKKTRKKKSGGGFFNRLLENQREKNRLKFAAKQKLAEAQVESAKSMGKGTAADVELAKSLGASTPTSDDTSTQTQGMSMTTKILIGVGVLGVLGIGAYFLLKKKKS